MMGRKHREWMGWALERKAMVLGRKRRWWRIWVCRKYRRACFRLESKRFERALRRHYAPIIWETLWETDPFLNEALL